MAIFKSVLAGLAGVVIAAILGLIVMIVTFIVWAKSHHTESSVGWDPISLRHSPIAWAVVLCGFALGFFWEYRRATRA